MSFTREGIAMLVASVVVLVLQVVLAPNIAIYSAMPNFVLAFVMVVAIARPGANAAPIAFVLGMLYNLVAGGPVGALAFLLVLVSLLATRAFSVLNNDTLFMPLVILVVSAFVVELLYALVMIVMGADIGFVGAFVYRALPCALYDCVVALIMYPLVTRFVIGGSESRTSVDMPNLR